METGTTESGSDLFEARESGRLRDSDAPGGSAIPDAAVPRDTTSDQIAFELRGEPASKALARALAEPFAFALVTWPAVVGLMVPLLADWGRIVVGVWLAAMQFAAYGGRRGAGFGNAMLAASGVVAAACLTYPSPWTLAWLAPLLVVLHTAQLARLRRFANP